MSSKTCPKSRLSTELVRVRVWRRILSWTGRARSAKKSTRRRGIQEKESRDSRIVSKQSDQRFRELIYLSKIEEDSDPSSLRVVEEVEVEIENGEIRRIVESWRREGRDEFRRASGVQVEVGEVWKGANSL